MLRFLTGLFTGFQQVHRRQHSQERVILAQGELIRELISRCDRLETRIVTLEGLVDAHYQQLHKLRGKVYGSNNAPRVDEVPFGDKAALRARVGLANGTGFKHDP
jgi:hypothetical protein